MEQPPRVPVENILRGPTAFPDFNPPAKVGVLYTKTWFAPLVNGVTDEWQKRVAGYWERIEIKYGLIMSRSALVYDPDTSTITTMATILAIVPGERYQLGDVH